MCTNPVLIRNNSKIIPLDDNFKMEFFVPCGHCAECCNAKFNEYTFRMYYHCLECFRRGGYVLLDCLTYATPYLNWFDVMFSLPSQFHIKCFNPYDVTLFLTRLRKKLAGLGFGNDAFSYFYVGEFGKTNTKRPHYHILFFVYANISPVDFSLLVSDCWYLGRTDGFRFGGFPRLTYNTFRVTNCDYSRLFTITNYLSKYLNKSLSEMSRSYRICLNALRWMYNINDASDLDYDLRCELVTMRKYLQPFHRQSQGFGLYALECFNLRELIKTGRFQIAVCNRVFNIAIPLYFLRKLFFQNVRNNDGSYSWVPRSETLNGYQQFLVYRLNEKIDNFRNKVESFNLNYEFKIKDLDLFVKWYFFEFGRINPDGVDSVVRSDLNRNVFNNMCHLNLYSYVHPRYRCSSLSNLPIEFCKIKEFECFSYSDFKNWYMESSFKSGSAADFYSSLCLLFRSFSESVVSIGKKQLVDFIQEVNDKLNNFINSKNLCYA